MRDFGVENSTEKPSIKRDEKEELRAHIADAIEKQDEEELDKLIEAAKALGDQIDW